MNSRALLHPMPQAAAPAAKPRVAAPLRQTDTRMPLRFVRHGATAPNLAGLRCGGDLDVPLVDVGREQAHAAGRALARLEPAVGVIYTSALLRNRETAAIVAEYLPQARVVIEPAFGERRLGAWNLLPIAQTQPWLEARLTPPGGESDDEFIDRIGQAVRGIKQQLAGRPLLVGSKGVARILGELVGLDGRLELDNGAIWEFDFAAHPCLETAWGAL